MTFPIPFSKGFQGASQTLVPVSVVVLARDEDANIGRCLDTLAWAAQVIVVDSGSRDRTVEVALSKGAKVVQTRWRGFAAQRQHALRLPVLKHEWVLFVDADEWVSADLAAEIGRVLRNPHHQAYWLHFRVIFQGRWIQHCGWYPSARIIRLMKRSMASYRTSEAFSEHPYIAGSIGRLCNDIIDQDEKGLAAWVRKHLEYAALEAERRRVTAGARAPRLANEHVLRHVLRNQLAPRLPCRPFFTFLYMYVLRRGFLDGRQGLLFCFMHMWFQALVNALHKEYDNQLRQACAVDGQTLC